MANKWRTTVTEANAVFEKYSVYPSDLSGEALTRKWTGIDRSVLYSLISTLRSTTTITDPKADGVPYPGVWYVDSVEPVLEEGGNLAGSATIIQVLKKNVYSVASPANVTIVRSRSYSLEQPENAWMYYERFRHEETKKWSNILAANIEAEFDKIKSITSPTTYVVNWELTDYYIIKYPVHTGAPVFGRYIDGGLLGESPDKTYWEPAISYSEALGYYVSDIVLIENPVIKECWYEQNPDGTYNLFRSMETTTTTGLMRTRSLTYAGMTLVSGLPTLDDTAISIKGFNNLTEVIYKDARFRIGSDTYRVTANKTAALGVAVNIQITPPITAATEDACDENPEQVQVFWDAL